MARPYRPTNETLRKVVKYMHDELNLHVYGDTIDFETGANHGCCADYTEDDVVKLREMIRKDQIWDYEPGLIPTRNLNDG